MPLTLPRKPWFAVDQVVQVSLRDRDDPAFAGRLMELSSDGARLSLSRTLAPGDMLTVRWNRTVLFGVIRSCRERPEGHWAELHLSDVVFASLEVATRWSQLFDDTVTASRYTAA